MNCNAHFQIGHPQKSFARGMQIGWDDGACREDQEDMLSHDSQSSSHLSRQKTQLPTSLPVMPPIVVCARNSLALKKVVQLKLDQP